MATMSGGVAPHLAEKWRVVGVAVTWAVLLSCFICPLEWKLGWEMSRLEVSNFTIESSLNSSTTHQRHPEADWQSLQARWQTGIVTSPRFLCWDQTVWSRNFGTELLNLSRRRPMLLVLGARKRGAGLHGVSRSYRASSLVTLTYHTYRLTVVYSTNPKPRYGSYASGLGLRSSNLDLLIKVPPVGASTWVAELAHILCQSQKS